MRLILSAVGQMKQGPERDLLARYVDRARALARSVGLTGFDGREIGESRARSVPERLRDEAAGLMQDLPPGGRVIVLDERGTALSSAEFAALVGQDRDAGRPALSLLIGGPDGLDPTLRAAADKVLCYGRATFPHQLVRVLAAEQCYRALTILAGHPYHRA